LLAAIGHAFFSLSLGMAAMITYGSYIKKDVNLVSSTNVIVASSIFIALLGGILIFSIAAAFQIDPGAGPGLAFIVLPEMFQQMTGGMVFSTIFFALLFIAALTSAISLIEVIVTFCVEETKLKRKTAAALVSVSVFMLGVICSISLGIMPNLGLFGLNFFGLMDYLSANILLPLAGLFTAIYVGWVLKKQIMKEELLDTSNMNEKFKSVFMRIFYFLMRYVVPCAILMVFISGLLK
jgi:NSS family neurotransmitter:Na+ symporter